MLFFIANKIDLVKKYNKVEGENFAKSIGAEFFECSALDFYVVNKMFKNIFKLYDQKYSKLNIYNDDSISIYNQNKKNCYCL